MGDWPDRRSPLFDPSPAVYRETKESDEWVLQNECAIALGATKDPCVSASTRGEYHLSSSSLLPHGALAALVARKPSPS